MKYNILFFIAFVCLFLPVTSQAGEFVELVGIPGLSGDPTAGGLSDYINALYRLSISIAALLAVIKIVIAGAKYMLSDIVTHKEDAKKDIQGALVGLLIVIGAIIILNTINSDLTNLEISIDTANVEQGPTIAEYLEQRQAALENRAAAAQSEIIIQNCPSYSFIGGGDRARCRAECSAMRGEFSANWDRDTCTFSAADAVACNPSSDAMCCENVHGGTFSESDTGARSCSGVAEARAERRLECGREERVWDEAGNYCRTASCSINTNANCCTAAGNTWQNNSCVDSGVTPTDEVDQLPESTITQLRGNLTGLSTELQNSIIQRAQNNIGGNLLTAGNNTAVVNEQGADAMVLSASLPANITPDRRTLIENTIEGVCSDTRQTATYSGAGVVTGTLADGTDYIACVR